MPGKNDSKALIKIPKLTGKYKQVRVTILGASFLKPDGSPGVKLADDAFGPFILNEIFRRQSILSKLKGVLKKTHHCRKCEDNLMGLTAHRRRFSLTIAYDGLPPFKLEIEMPAIPCRKCGTSNAVNEEVTELIITGAIAKAFEPLKSAVSN
jgi:hypothetical protein